MLSLIPWDAFFGGMLLGVSAIVLMLGIGRVAGISGIVSRLLPVRTSNNESKGVDTDKTDKHWRIAFIVGMVVSGWLLIPTGYQLPQLAEMNLVVVVIAGLLVGYGTKTANGCTSGHGIVGMARLSKRSIIATCVFMSVAIATVLIKNLIGLGA
ncbi:Sulf_transp domain-containing protein [Vibrio chagasii]|uniref:YeeE/YedE family protein n=1 Tax=Vibrio TaxID=662 RepID=UPI000E328FBC|nr:YeeE/YedE family protein [Vibrio splendidus]MCG9606116.1 YeeE/YedE family protein [Vibrio chagasii]MDE9381719.1 YeeE/YedE family protein [Vibrio alginolyticus]CAH6782671.1 Sulf_transp domain-containing protein [Vibrio chagasii]CAH6840028.1 Sulf_transp domain-containing protein [Vibrio chagasii]CAH6892065.1 Sulf_transp domain-containing protein [Vibrio chagasii]